MRSLSTGQAWVHYSPNWPEQQQTDPGFDPRSHPALRLAACCTARDIEVSALLQSVTLSRISVRRDAAIILTGTHQQGETRAS